MHAFNTSRVIPVRYKVAHPTCRCYRGQIIFNKSAMGLIGLKNGMQILISEEGNGTYKVVKCRAYTPNARNVSKKSGCQYSIYVNQLAELKTKYSVLETDETFDGNPVFLLKPIANKDGGNKKAQTHDA